MNRDPEGLLEILRQYVTPMVAKSVLTLGCTRAQVDVHRILPGDDRRLLRALDRALNLYLPDAGRREECLQRIAGVLSAPVSAEANAQMSHQVIPIREEADIVKARSAGREQCRALGFPAAVQIKVATAISELARNIVQYAGEGELSLGVIEEERRGIEVVASDHGPGISGLDRILSGQYRSAHGMGMGLLGTKNLMDEFDIQTAPGEGTRVTARKYLT